MSILLKDIKIKEKKLKPQRSQRKEETMQNVKLAINNLKWFLKIDSFALLIDNF